MPNDDGRRSLAPSGAVFGIAERDPRDRGALVPTNMREAMDFAISMASGRLSIPEFLHNNPGDCLRLVLVAGRTGLDPFMLADQTYIVPSSKRMAFQAQAIHAIALASGVLVGDVDVKITNTGEDMIAHATGQRRGRQPKTEGPYIFRSITPKNSPLWKSQPRQQFIYYCQRAWCRLHAADALMGLVAREDPIDVTAVEVDETPPPASAVDKVAAQLSGVYAPNIAGATDGMGTTIVPTSPVTPQTSDPEDMRDLPPPDPDTGEIPTGFDALIANIDAMAARNAPDDEFVSWWRTFRDDIGLLTAKENDALRNHFSAKRPGNKPKPQPENPMVGA